MVMTAAEATGLCNAETTLTTRGVRSVRSPPENVDSETEITTTLHPRDVSQEF